MKLNNVKYLALGILFLPSVNFWCSGISKDTIILIATFALVYHVFHIISLQKQSSLQNYIYVLISAFVIYHIRSFILIAIAVPIVFSLGTRLVKQLGSGAVGVFLFRLLIIGAGFFVVGQSFLTTSEEDFLASNRFLQEASVIQNDFAHNVTYGDKKYDLGNVEFTPVGLIKIMPLAVITGIYRPFLWEALSPTLIMNGIESIVFLYFTFLFFSRNSKNKWHQINRSEFLIFCLIFMLIVAYMTGLTSILYGVLVRLRAPLLPFLFVLLTLESRKQKVLKESDLLDNNLIH